MADLVPFQKRGMCSEESRFVEFQHTWEMDIQPFHTYEFPSCFDSGPVRTVHDNIGLEWETSVFPAGVRTENDGMEHRDHIAIFQYYKRGVHKKLEDLEILVFVDGCKVRVG